MISDDISNKEPETIRKINFLREILLFLMISSLGIYRMLGQKEKTNLDKSNVYMIFIPKFYCILILYFILTHIGDDIILVFPCGPYFTKFKPR